MFHKLKRRLVLLYGITSSIILTVIMAGAFFIYYNQNRQQLRVLFEKNVEQIVEMIRTKNVIDYNWMIKIQQENNLTVYIDENGFPLSNYNRLDTANKDTAKWKDRITERAAGEGIYLNQRPLYQTIEKTSVYNLQQNIMETNLGMATIIPTNTGWLTIMALYYDRKGIASDFRQIILFVFIDILGAAALFLISSIYINKVLRPLEEGQKKQKEFIAAASHELRSPLTIIKAGISSVREDNSKSNQFLPHIERECDRMTNLINDMLLLASADARTWTFKREQVDMDTLLIESYDMFCSCYNKNNYQLALDLPEEKLHKIIGDRERIKQILTILMDNAMNYSLSGNQITIRAYNQKHCVVIEVEDHGSGIKDEEKKQIFERFYQGDKSRNDKKHFGLGLSIAKELVELHNGDIFVKDTMGGGTTFVLRLPD